MTWIGILIGCLLVCIILQALYIRNLRTVFREMVLRLERLRAMIEGYNFAKDEKSQEEKI